MIKLVLWDWNGTILDDVYQSMEAVNRMLDRKNMPRIDIDKYYSLVDTPIERFYHKLFGTTDIDFAEIAHEFHNDYDEQIPTLSLNDGANEMLEYFESIGAKQAVISSAHVDMIEKVIDNFDVRKYFDVILASRDKEAGSKIERAKKYFENVRISPDETIFIGDTLHDFETAKALGVKCILTTQGHQTRREFKSIDALIVDNLEEINL